MGEVVPARTSLTLHPPSPPTVHQLSRLALEELIIIRATKILVRATKSFSLRCGPAQWNQVRACVA